MKFWVCSIGTAGDVYPLIAVGHALKQRGHIVHMASMERYQSLIEAAGMVFEKIPGVLGASGLPDFYHPTRGMRLIAERMLIPAIQPLYAMTRGLDPKEWTIVADSFCYGARLVAEKHGFKLITCLVSPFGLRTAYGMPAMTPIEYPRWLSRLLSRPYYFMLGKMWDRLICPSFNALRNDLGMAPVNDIWFGWALSTSRIIGLFPEWYAPRKPDWPAHFVYGGFSTDTFIEQTSLPEEIQKMREDLVVFCAGSAGQAADNFFQAALAASKGQPWQAVLLRGDTVDSLTSTLPNVRIFRYIPLTPLLARASAIVHHGGLGTLSLALAAGVPQIIIPFGHDQYQNAARLKELGVGRSILKKTNLVQHLKNILKTTLNDPSLKKRCQELAFKAQEGHALESICHQIERDTAA